MTHVNDDKHCALLQLTGQASGTINDMVATWLRAETGATHSGINDLWHEYWDQELIAPGHFNDRAYEWLQGLGYLGETNNDLWAAYWADMCLTGGSLKALGGWTDGVDCLGGETVVRFSQAFTSTPDYISTWTFTKTGTNPESGVAPTLATPDLVNNRIAFTVPWAIPPVAEEVVTGSYLALGGTYVDSELTP
ncbi:MAG: hypothetical protein DRQ56_05775, partial [Gammaproteobacteria bacterium]